MPVKMLVVDDDSIVLTALERAFRTVFRESINLTAISDSVTACEWIAVNRPDLVVTDFNMPQINGLSLSNVVKAYSPDARVIMYSGSDEACELSSQNGHGVDEFVSKNRGLRELVSVLSRLLPRIVHKGGND